MPMSEKPMNIMTFQKIFYFIHQIPGRIFHLIFPFMEFALYGFVVEASKNSHSKIDE